MAPRRSSVSMNISIASACFTSVASARATSPTLLCVPPSGGLSARSRLRSAVTGLSSVANPGSDATHPDIAVLQRLPPASPVAVLRCSSFFGLLLTAAARSAMRKIATHVVTGTFFCSRIEPTSL